MKKFTVEVVNRKTGEVVESHNTNKIAICLKLIRCMARFRGMYTLYCESDLRITDNATGKEMVVTR